MKTSAEKLKMLRELKGLSQADCAKALGLDRTTYVKYENGGSVRRNVEKLARFFRVSTDYLLGNTDNPVRPYAEMDQDEMNEPVQEVVTLRDKYGRLRKDKSVPIYSEDTLDKSIACAKKLIEEDPLPAPAHPSLHKSTTEYGVRIPVLGRVVAGIPIEAIEEVIDWEEIPQRLAASGKFFALRVCGHSMEPRILEGDVVIVRQQEDVESGDIAIVMVNGDEATVKRVKKQEDGITLIATNTSVYEPHFYSNQEIRDLPVRILGKVVELRGKV